MREFPVRKGFKRRVAPRDKATLALLVVNLRNARVDRLNLKTTRNPTNHRESLACINKENEDPKEQCHNH